MWDHHHCQLWLSHALTAFVPVCSSTTASLEDPGPLSCHGKLWAQLASGYASKLMAAERAFHHVHSWSGLATSQLICSPHSSW